jgi:purine-binding chemotaxis protein CheW
MSALLLIVRLAGERVAFPAEEVESVVEIGAVTPVPRAAPHVAGLAALRSRVLTVIDTSASLGLAPAAQWRDAAVATVDGHGYALLLDAVEDVVPADGDPRPLPGRLEGEWARVARGSVEVEGDLLLLLDVGALVGGPRAEAA